MKMQYDAYMERMGATASREAMMMPISQMLAVSRRAQVGSPLALPCPNTCGNMRSNQMKFYSNNFIVTT